MPTAPITDTVISPDAHEKWLEAFNATWANRHRIFQSCAPPPWWAPGLALTAEIRQNYEKYLPVAEYLQDLATLVLPRLPHPSWLPVVLKRSLALSYVGAAGLPASLPDLWSLLPPRFAGRLSWADGDLLPLACAIAAPLKFGSRTGRYPEQTQYLVEWLRQSNRSLLVVDYGCGTGQGTYEIAALVARSGRPGRVIGVTPEPLEAWMALNRGLPHLDMARPTDPVNKPIAGKSSISITDTPSRATDAGTNDGFAFPVPTSTVPILFAAGDIRNFALSRRADVILCNGLIGGPALNDDRTLKHIWVRIQDQLADNGIFVIGSRFHAGCTPRIERFIAAAERHAFAGAPLAGSCVFQRRPNASLPA